MAHLFSLTGCQRGARAAGNGISKILTTSQARIRFATRVTVKIGVEKKAAELSQDKELVKEDHGQTWKQPRHDRKWF